MQLRQRSSLALACTVAAILSIRWTAMSTTDACGTLAPLGRPRGLESWLPAARSSGVGCRRGGLEDCEPRGLAASLAERR